jgi:Holliday junction resolvase RusA-like endonuclease
MRWYEVSPIPIKRRARFRRNGTAYTDPRTKADLGRIADSWDGCLYPSDVPLALIVEVYQQLPKSRARRLMEPFTLKPDVDNIIKAVMDGLNGVAFEDDKQITFVSCHKRNRTTDIKGEYVKYALLPTKELRNIG